MIFIIFISRSLTGQWQYKGGLYEVFCGYIITNILKHKYKRWKLIGSLLFNKRSSDYPVRISDIWFRLSTNIKKYRQWHGRRICTNKLSREFKFNKTFSSNEIVRTKLDSTQITSMGTVFFCNTVVFETELLAGQKLSALTKSVHFS